MLIARPFEFKVLQNKNHHKAKKMNGKLGDKLAKYTEANDNGPDKNRQFTKWKPQMAIKYMEKYSDMKIKSVR